MDIRILLTDLLPMMKHLRTTHNESYLAAVDGEMIDGGQSRQAVSIAHVDTAKLTSRQCLSSEHPSVRLRKTCHFRWGDALSYI